MSDGFVKPLMKSCRNLFWSFNNQMNRIFLKRRFFIALLTLSLLVSNSGLLTASQYRVTRVTDGDTIQVVAGDTKTTVRLVGIDASEVSHSKNRPGQPFSKAAAKHLAAMVLNKTVEIKSYGPDRYGRTLAEVVAGRRNMNLEMLRAGLAEVYRGKPPPGLDMRPYWKEEYDAKAAKRGMWAQGDDYVSPKEWRKAHGN